MRKSKNRCAVGAANASLLMFLLFVVGIACDDPPPIQSPDNPPEPLVFDPPPGIAPIGKVNELYILQFQARGEVGPIEIAPLSPAPPGLQFVGGMLLGLPTTVGQFLAVIQAKDTKGTVARAFGKSKSNPLEAEIPRQAATHPHR